MNTVIPDRIRLRLFGEEVRNRFYALLVPCTISDLTVGAEYWITRDRTEPPGTLDRVRIVRYEHPTLVYLGRRSSGCLNLDGSPCPQFYRAELDHITALLYDGYADLLAHCDCCGVEY